MQLTRHVFCGRDFRSGLLNFTFIFRFRSPIKWGFQDPQVLPGAIALSRDGVGGCFLDTSLLVLQERGDAGGDAVEDADVSVDMEYLNEVS